MLFNSVQSSLVQKNISVGLLVLLSLYNPDVGGGGAANLPVLYVWKILKFIFLRIPGLLGLCINVNHLEKWTHNLYLVNCRPGSLVFGHSFRFKKKQDLPFSQEKNCLKAVSRAPKNVLYNVYLNNFKV